MSSAKPASLSHFFRSRQTNCICFKGSLLIVAINCLREPNYNRNTLRPRVFLDATLYFLSFAQACARMVMRFAAQTAYCAVAAQLGHGWHLPVQGLRAERPAHQRPSAGDRLPQ